MRNEGLAGIRLFEAGSDCDCHEPYMVIRFAKRYAFGTKNGGGFNMRKLALIAFVLVAGCSGEEPQKKATPAAAVKLQPGQWETTVEVTNLSMSDKSPAAPGIIGKKTTVSNCITPEQVEKPEAALFTGGSSNCKYDNLYMSDGRLSSSMTCTQPGRSGNSSSMVDGSYTATTFDATVETQTYSGSHDFKMDAKVSGHRIGECTAAATTAEPAKKS